MGIDDKPIAIVKGTVLDNYLEFNVFFDGNDTFTLKNECVTIQLTKIQMAEKVISFTIPVLYGRDELLKAILKNHKAIEFADKEKHSELFKELDKIAKEKVTNFFEKTDGK